MWLWMAPSCHGLVCARVYTRDVLPSSPLPFIQYSGMTYICTCTRVLLYIYPSGGGEIRNTHLFPEWVSSFVSSHARGWVTNLQKWAGATFFWVRNCNSASWRKHFRTCNSAIAIFSEVRNFKSATSSRQLQVRDLKASLPQFSAYFYPCNPVSSRKKIEG